MSNQPKIIYRSDSTGCSYQMMQQDRVFTIQMVNIDNQIVKESPVYAYAFPWRKTIDIFFDIVTDHINCGEWEA